MVVASITTSVHVATASSRISTPLKLLLFEWWMLDYWWFADESFN